MISDGNGNIRWCARCSRRAASSYCEGWLCKECYDATHARNQDGVLVHALRGDALVSDDRGMMTVEVRFTRDDSPLLVPKRRRS